ncbi:MAG: RtcB family protein [Planctomycetota bacterium]|jgi:tRNA-splicing ligase RtcB
MEKEVTINIEQIDEYRFRVPKQGAMRVDGIVYANEKMIRDIRRDQSLQQVVNVATLPGIVRASMAMPDIHEGYGFPIGGVAAFDNTGVISPGGVGYDINCGVRVIRSNLRLEDVTGLMTELVNTLFRNIPTGVGSQRKDLKLSHHELGSLLKKGARWAVTKGYGWESDINHIEEGGCIGGADPTEVSQKALERGRAQVGTLGSGNHFVEVDLISEVYDEELARVLGLERGGIAIQIHTGSRGLGYQVCDDFISVMIAAARKYGIELPDRQLCCAPLDSDEGERYFAAMACAANFAFANRQMITHWVRESFSRVLHRKPEELSLGLIYDVCHNIAKFEDHLVDGGTKRLCVHRKGATRALPPGHPQTPEAYKTTGQPVLIPGDMGRYSYVLVGTEAASTETFASCCHGAGRLMSRTRAAKSVRGKDIINAMQKLGVVVRATGRRTLAEEIPEAYKDVTDVVDIVHNAGIAKKVVQLRPLGVIKG